VRVTTWRLGQATARFIALSLAGRTLEVRYGFVTTKVPVVEFDGIDIDQVPLTESLRVIEDGLAAHQSDSIPIAPVDTLAIMQLLAGRGSGHGR
jgi:hypothetical protein